MTGELASTHTRLRAQIMRNEERERWFQAQLSESNDTIEALGLNLKEAKILNEDSENSTCVVLSNLGNNRNVNSNIHQVRRH